MKNRPKGGFSMEVGMGRLELPILTECASETHAYTNSATTASFGEPAYCLLRSPGQSNKA